MVKRVIWSARSKQDMRNILEYWLKRNKSNVYPRKLNKLFKLAVKSIASSSIPRKESDYKGVFVKIVKDYLILFEEDDMNVYILTIWDTRQDPEKLRKVLE